LLAWLAFGWLKTNLYQPQGIDLNLANLAPLWFAVPIPLTVVGFVFLSVRRVFARLDAVAIVEQGKLSTEAQGRPAAKRSSSRPLSFWTFYLRHRLRGVMLAGAMALMILGVAFPAFFISPSLKAYEPFRLSYLYHVSEVKPGEGHTVDAAVTSQLRANPAVARVVPATELPLAVSIPFSSLTFGKLYGVSETDLPVLVELFGMQLKDGRLPQPRSNEIALSETLALNRDLRPGDAVGSPVYEQDGYIPTEMVVVGILESSDVSLGLASFEYLEGHELYSSRSVHLLVVPAQGRKAEVDRWLEEEVASTQTLVETHDTAQGEFQQLTQGLLSLVAVVESIIAVVAAIAVAALNYIFFSQRRDEFGVLHAIGRGRLWLVLRTVKETGSVVAVAWLIGAGVCVVGLMAASTYVYAPKGLSVNLSDLTPWLFTLPIPLAVVAASAGTIAWTLSRLDPVSVIERRPS